VELTSDAAREHHATAVRALDDVRRWKDSATRIARGWASTRLRTATGWRMHGEKAVVEAIVLRRADAGSGVRAA
jgi:hypothetical protein